MFYDEEAFFTLSAQLDALNRKMDKYIVSNMYVQNRTCDYCGAGHAYLECQIDNWFYPSSEQTNFVSDFYMPPNNSYFNTYYPEWRNQLNFPEFQPQENKSELKELLKSFINSSETRLKNQEAAFKNMEIQLGHLTNMLLEESHVSNYGK